MLQKIAKQYRNLRIAKGYSIDKITETNKINKNSICNFEKGIGNPQIKTLQRLADAIDCELEINFVDKETEFVFDTKLLALMASDGEKIVFKRIGSKK